MHAQIQIINSSIYALPAYATYGASGLDLRANIKDAIHLKSLERSLIPTGIQIAIPTGMEAQVRPRSGLALKKGITCLNSPGTIDADYRGEIGVILINLSANEVVIEPGDRIAQLVFQPVIRIDWRPVVELTITDRAAGGFGSTGI